MVTTSPSATPQAERIAAAARRSGGTLTDTDIAAIERAVATLLDGLDVRPTDLDAVAQLLQVEFDPRDDLPYSAVLQRDEHGALKIAFARDQSATRRRFTLAHELAHAYLEVNVADPPRSGTRVERICDRFAEELLMPTPMVRDIVTETLTVERLRMTARQFGASLQAAAIRCSRFATMAVFTADDRGVVWAAGATRADFSPFLHEIARAVITDGRPQRLPVSRQGPSGAEPWTLEARRHVHFPTDAVLLLSPERP